MRTLVFFALAIGITLPGFSQDPEVLLRHPSLNTDGDEIAFSYQGDIWVVSAAGGAARRLTIHESYESHPQWSPDDMEILFQSNRYGNSDLFVTTPAGAKPRRLTYHSNSDEEARWAPDGKIVFTTARNFVEVEREDEIFQIDREGGTPVRILDAVGLSPAVSPDGRYIAFIRGNCRVVREAYRGPANREIWIYDRENETYKQITDFDGQDIYPDWGPDNTLFFLSARNGRYNLYSLPIVEGAASGSPRAITDFGDEGIRYYDLSANGQRVVFTRGAFVYTMPADGSADPQRVNIDVTTDYRFDPVVRESFNSDLSDYGLSPDNELVALQIRGEIFVMPEDEDRSRTRQLTQHAANDRSPRWLNDSTLLFLSDRHGNYDLFALRSVDMDDQNLYTSLKREVVPLTETEDDEVYFQLSPDRSRIAIQRNRGRLVVADIDSTGRLSNERTLLDGWASASPVSWSPDGQWLAYSLDDLDFNSEIYIHAADASADPVNVSLHPRGDESPVWSADGSKLGFISNRNNGNDDVWFVWLREADWEKTQREWEETDEEVAQAASGDSLEVIIDFDNIHERLVQVTRLPGNEGDLQISPDGETFYYSTNGGSRQGSSGDPDFMSISWDGEDATTLLENTPVSDLHWGKDGNNLYYSSRGRLARLNVSSKKSQNLPFRAEMEMDLEAQREQIFDEAWRGLKMGFYDPQFHGRDWEALRAHYRPLALAASTSQDFRDIFNEMLGQLNASHMGMYGSDPEETQEDRTGQLGTEGTMVDAGFRIDRIVPESPADRKASKLNVGEIITAVNGQEVDPNLNFYRLLQGTVNERTLLDVQSTDGTTREVIIRPTGSLRSELYEAWVEERRRLTDQYSNGRLGYIHIQGMNWPSFERFERELMASGLGKEGMVIDVRFNGGGWTTDMLMTVLNVRQHSYTIPRGAAGNLEAENQKFREHYPFGERLPFSALTKPSIALCNENSYSNAEIFSHAYKTLNLGTLVGQPTFGAVISTGGMGLIDGSYIRMPFRAWYVKATGENMEHGPAVPDIVVDNPPGSKARGEDPQLEVAVGTLLEQIDGQDDNSSAPGNRRR